MRLVIAFAALEGPFITPATTGHPMGGGPEATLTDSGRLRGNTPSVAAASPVRSYNADKELRKQRGSP